LDILFLGKDTVSTIKKYGQNWPGDTDPLFIELFAIARDGHWKNKKGQDCGEGLLWHKIQAFKLAWPKKYCHRWTELILKESSENLFTVFLGAASAQKTSTVSASFMLDWWARPDKTLFIISTTTIIKLENSIFAQIKTMFSEAKELHPWLNGRVVDYKHAIMYESDDENSPRNMDRGIIGIACREKNSGGLGGWAGIKQVHMRIAADDLTWMKNAFLGSLENLYSNGEVKTAAMCNPDHDTTNQCGIAAEPVRGWSSYAEPDKTTIWPVKLFNGKCVNLVGTDSPNFDYPNEPEHFPGLLGPRYAQLIATNPGGVNSPRYKTMVKGVMCLGMMSKRVISREQCEKHHAYESPEWAGMERTKLAYVDPAYGGGDDCVIFHGEFGKASNGKTILAIVDHHVIPIIVTQPGSSGYMTPEEQIARGVERDLKERQCPPQNCGYDSFGKGTVGQAFGSIFGRVAPIPVNAGGPATKRIVKQGYYAFDGTVQTNRLKLCDDEFDRFITELWFMVSYTIDADQLRGITEDTVEEGCAREYEGGVGGRIRIEKKEDMKERLQGRSPNNFDALAGLVEMARRLGFVIDSVGSEKDIETDEPDYFELEAQAYRERIRGSLLTRM
jgi:hypothetical protein